MDAAHLVRKETGGQPGRRKAERPLIPTDQCDHIEQHKPDVSANCGGALSGDDPEPVRKQVIDLLPVRPIVTEHQIHTLNCACCGAATAGTLPEHVPRGWFGPQVVTVVTLLTRLGRLSHRVMAELLQRLFGLEISVGQISRLQRIGRASLRPGLEEITAAVRSSEVVNIDETGWRENGRRAWLWAVVGSLATLFAVRASRSHLTTGGEVRVDNSGTLTGSGVVDTGGSRIIVESNGTIDPGSLTGPGILQTRNVTFGGNSNFDVQLDGTIAGAGYDQLDVNGTVTLDGDLDVTLLTSFASVGDTFTIIDNDGTDAISGTFDDLPEGGLVDFGGNVFSVSYRGGTDNNDVVLTTETVNHFPTGNPQSVTTNEETPVNITLTGNDVDGDPFTFSIDSGPSHGTLSGSGVNLTYTPFLNYAGPDSFVFRITDDKDGFTTAIVSIRVNNTQDPPTQVNLSASALDENTSSGTIVGTLTTNDPDVGDTFTDALVSGTGDADNGSFTIVGHQLKSLITPDFETENSYSVRVKSTDAAGDSVERAFTIAINDVNEAPTPLALSSTSVDESVSAGTVVGTFSSTDPDAGDSHTYTLVGGSGDADNGSFTIDGNQLKISVIPDYEAKSSYSIRVRSTDSGNLSFERTFTITINDLPDQPISGATWLRTSPPITASTSPIPASAPRSSMSAPAAQPSMWRTIPI